MLSYDKIISSNKQNKTMNTKEQFESLPTNEKLKIINIITDLEKIRLQGKLPSFEEAMNKLSQSSHRKIALECYRAQLNGENWY